MPQRYKRCFRSREIGTVFDSAENARRKAVLGYNVICGSGGMHEKTILVTGGAGFIGSNFIYMLLEERPEWKVVCVDALTYAANIHTLNKAFDNPNFVFHKEDIRNREGICCYLFFIETVYRNTQWLIFMQKSTRKH